MKGLFGFCTAVAILIATASTGAEAISFSIIEKRLINANERCSACHGTGKEREALTYEVMKGYLEEATEEEILSDEWFPMTYCNGPIDDAGKRLLIEWQRAGFPR